MLHGDFEGRSFCDLLERGVYNYAMDESTQATMFAFAFDDEEPEICIPLRGNFWDRLYASLRDKGVIVHSLLPKRVIQHMLSGGQMAAHNAAFERLIFKHVMAPQLGIPVFPDDAYYCTAAQARANNLPGALGNCAQAMGAAQQKDKRGNELIQILCVPHEGKFIEDLDLYVEFALYCLQDVRAERAIHKAMRPLTDRELEEYHANERINDAGLKIDRELAIAAASYADAEQADLVQEIKAATKDAVSKARGKTLTNWVYERLPEPQQKHMHKHKDGERKLSLDRRARERIITDPDTPPLVKKVVEYSDFAQASSTGKFKAMVSRANDDDRVRGAYVFNGAASTGRLSSKGLQVHNFPRDSLKNPDDIADMLVSGASPNEIEQASNHSLMQALKRLLRHSIIAEEGKIFVCGDWSQVEGRMCPWLSMGDNAIWDKYAQLKLRMYEKQTEENDVYCQAGTDIFGRRVIRDGSPAAESDRQIGKVAELSLQFGGGQGAFQSMAGNYGVYVPNERADEIKVGWRNANPWAQPFWYGLHKAAVKAVQNPGIVFRAGRVQFMFQPEALMGCLWMLLPSGRVLAYPEARVDMVEGKYGVRAELSALKSNWTPKAGEKEWPRINLWYGVLCENATQAECGSLLRDAFTELVLDYDAPVVGHTHDEILIECDVSERGYWNAQLVDTMVNASSEWAKGLPLAVDTWTGYNFRK